MAEAREKVVERFIQGMKEEGLPITIEKAKKMVDDFYKQKFDMRKVFLKSVKEYLFQDGFKLDPYLSSTNNALYYKPVDGLKFYVNISFDKSAGWFELYLSKMIITNILNYGEVDPPVIHNSMYPMLINDTNIETKHKLTPFILSDYENSQIAFETFKLDFKKAEEYFLCKYIQVIKTSEIVNKKYNYLKKLTEDFFSPEIANLEEDEIAPFILKKYGDRVNHRELAENKSATEIMNGCLPEEFVMKKLLKKLRTDLKTLDRYLVFVIMMMRVKTGDIDIDRMFRLTDERRPFGDTRSLMYSAFMTFIEKAY